MRYTDKQLKAVLAKMLPDDVTYEEKGDGLGDWQELRWKQAPCNLIKPTEYLHLCWMVEEAFRMDELLLYRDLMWDETRSPHVNKAMFEMLHATPSQRITALAKVKGINL